MAQFSPDQVGFGDTIGAGIWDDGHAREHMQFVLLFLQQTPSVNIPDVPLFYLLSAGYSQRFALEAHAQAHAALRAATGVQGIDLANVDLKAEDAFADWLGAHATEHAQIRQVLGI